VDDRDGGAFASPAPARNAGNGGRARRSPARALALAAALAAASLLGVWCDAGAPPRIVYPYPWLGSALARVAQPAINAMARRRVAVIPESLLARPTLPGGYAGDVDYAEAMTALPGVVAAVGPQSSRATLLVAPIYAEHGIPLISPTATSRRLHALGPRVFQLAPDDEVEGAFMADFALDRLAARRVTVFYLDADEFGLGLRDGVVRALALRGVKPVDQVGIIEGTDMARRVAESLRRATPDVVIVAARAPEAIRLVRALHERLAGARIVASDGVPLDAGFIRSAGAAAEGVYSVAWWSPLLADSASRAFAAAYRRAAGEDPSPAVAMYYDAIMVAARAVREVGPRRRAIALYLSELGVSRPAYRGVTGPVSFSPQRPVNLLMTHVADGAVELVAGAEAGP
jgi:branched-chain amino acid transport system substrate-binding protein